MALLAVSFAARIKTRSPCLPVFGAAVFLGMVADAVLARHEDHGGWTPRTGADAVVACTARQGTPAIWPDEVVCCLFDGPDTVLVELDGWRFRVDGPAESHTLAVLFGNGVKRCQTEPLHFSDDSTLR